MHKIHLDLGPESYDIAVGSGILERLSEFLRPLLSPSRILIISNTTVFEIYGKALGEALTPLQCEILHELIPDGEEYKNMVTIGSLLDSMAQARLDRKSLIVSLGGGVVGDIAGFAAAIYMRGLPYVHVPTTLLAQVDSSIGGKVGVDHALGKNLIGSFYQPLFVCIDTDTLTSLPDEQYRNGLAEVIKYGVIADEGLFAQLERHIDTLRQMGGGMLSDTIKRCCQIKARIVQLDTKETTGLRSILNYGHTVGHALESVTGYARYSHGEAVAIGMVAAAKIAVSLQLTPQGLDERQQHLLLSVGLPIKMERVKAADLLASMQLDKKASNGKLKFVIPIAIGRAIIKENISPDIIERALHDAGAE